MKSNFMASMSHDMRTPMNGILGMIRLSKESDNLEEINHNLDKAQSAGEYMLSLINDTLDLQRIEAKKLDLNYEVVHVSEYYDSIFSIMKVSAEQKNIEYEVHYIGIDMDKYIRLDPLRVKQILSNLVSNAIKFTPEGGAVIITVEALGEDHKVMHRKYQVQDTGIGMSPEFIRERLFKAYSQENNQASSGLTGSGLGMAITKNLVELMGGRIEVISEQGEGTTFTVYLDIEKANADESHKTRKSREENAEKIMAGLAGKRILICEDHPLNAEITRKLLEKANCEVIWEQDGKLGVERFAKEAEGYFDTILMDIRMPNMNGLEATRAIRNMKDRTDAMTIPIIAMTANAYDSDKKNSCDAGMNAHLAKPVNPMEMYETIYECLNR